MESEISQPDVGVSGTRLRAESDLRSALKAHFGLNAFRPGQEEAVRSLLEGRDVLALLPTGAGKSLVYQFAAQFLPGATIVVSPLIALMKDQLDSLEEQGVAASVINSSQSEAESEAQLRQVTNADSKLLYVTPERFLDDDFMAQAVKLRVSLFVVDEAHCISEWGHDFRPAYLNLKSAVEQLGRPILLALTATATPWVRDEIIERLGMRDPRLVVRGFDRPNLFFEVHRVEDESEDYWVLAGLFSEDGEDQSNALSEDLLRCMRGSGIIYTSTTKAATETSKWLHEWGVAADYYHGRRPKAERTRVQEAFMSGEIRVIAATNAFGLGVDKPDVRFVIHRDIPGSIEAYYQEAGRAGRDGLPARSILIYRPGDLGGVAALSGSGPMTREDVAALLQSLRASDRMTRKELQEATGLSSSTVIRAVALLKELHIADERRGRVRLIDRDVTPDGVSLEREEHRRAYERSRLEMMRAYAELDDCRRRYILNYFGEEYPSARCGLCDNDLASNTGSGIPKDTADGPFVVGDRVRHDSWGSGVVHRAVDGRIIVLFEEAGYKTLATEVVVDDGILTTQKDS